MNAPSPDRHPTSRFSGLSEEYDRGRPGYPDELFRAVVELGQLQAGDAVADLGAGTGISSEPFARLGLRVWAIEPNAAMRAAAARRLGSLPGVVLAAGSAEVTGLADRSVDLAFAAQSFHWFDPGRTRDELRRILRHPRASVALVWNARRSAGSPFVEAYERLLLRHGTDYGQVGHRGVGRERLRSFFGGDFVDRSFPHRQRLDRAGLRSRLLSSSYVPAAGQPGHDAMMRDLEALFIAHESAGHVELTYDCELWIGPLA